MSYFYYNLQIFLIYNDIRYYFLNNIPQLFLGFKPFTFITTDEIYVPSIECFKSYLSVFQELSNFDNKIVIVFLETVLRFSSIYMYNILFLNY